MIRYSTGLEKHLARLETRVRWRVKRAWSNATGYPVYRPFVDHSVYAVDNRVLGSSAPERARITHQVSWTSEIPGGCVVEFEHPFALVGHIGEDTDYTRFRDGWRASWARFFRWFEPGRHRLVGASDGAVAALHAVARDNGRAVAREAVEVVRWSMERRPRARAPARGALTVFHYGGRHPYAKGTHDVLAVARRLRDVRFAMSVDPGHPAIARADLPPNVEVRPYTSRRDYEAMIDGSHVVLCPLYSDGWGVILDALARALPVVIYDSYDKREAVIDGETGVLVPLPRELSLYDGFWDGSYRNWDEYNKFVAGSTSSARVDALAAAVASYDDDRARLWRAHSDGAARLLAERHGPARRIARIRGIYAEILAALGDRPPAAGVAR